jgi:hypothetical protein
VRALVAVGLLSVAGVARADGIDIGGRDLKEASPKVTDGAFETKALYALRRRNGTGVFMGGQFTQFLGGGFYLGGGGFGGELLGRPGQTGGMGYGGLIAGLEAKLTDGLWCDFGALIGGGGGTPAPGDPAAGFIVEPSVALGLKIVPGLRLGLTASYLDMPGSGGLSGFTSGLVVSFKSFNLSWPE